MTRFVSQVPREQEGLRAVAGRFFDQMGFGHMTLSLLLLVTAVMAVEVTLRVPGSPLYCFVRSLVLALVLALAVDWGLAAQLLPPV